MKLGVNAHVESISPSALVWGRKASLVVLIGVVLMSISGCESLWTKGMLKTDLNKFLDGDALQEPVEEVEVVEDLPPVEVEVAEPVAVIEEVVVPIERCAAEVDAKFSYKRRVAILAFDIHQRQDTADFPHIDRQYPDLLSRYVDQDRFIVNTATTYRLLNHVDLGNGAWVEPDRQQVKHLANELNVQFVVTGIVDDMSVVSPDVNAVNFALDHTVRKKWRGKIKRNLAVTLSVFDGGTGMLIKRQMFADDTYVDSRMLQNRKSLSKAFLRSQYGELMTTILKKQGEFFLSALDCIPLQAKVIAVDKRGVTFNAGIENMIISGDKLQIFRRVDIDWSDNSSSNYRLEKYGSLTVSRSGPSYAYALFEEDDMSSGINPGDIVQAW